MSLSKRLLWAWSASAVVAAAGCNDSAPAGNAPPPAEAPRQTLQVVCTTGQVAEMVRAVGGAAVQVEVLMGPGVDPHLFRATPGTTRKLGEADVVFYNGLHLEGRMAEMLEQLSARKPVLSLGDTLAKEQAPRLLKPPEFEGTYDPHVWFDLELWAECVPAVVARLVQLDPARQADYQRRGDAYAAELRALHSECRQRLAQIPRPQRVLVTAHDAFGYFGRAYDVEVHGLQGISTADEADLAGVTSLVDLLVERKVKAVFIESSVPPKNVQSLIEGCAARGHQVALGGELFSDALGPAGSPGETFTGMIRHNLETIVRALQ
jgi:manganese/zinc/iron transport system substrate-binding protein